MNTAKREINMNPKEILNKYVVGAMSKQELEMSMQHIKQHEGQFSREYRELKEGYQNIQERRRFSQEQQHD